MTAIATFDPPHLAISVEAVRDFRDRHEIRILAVSGSLIRHDFSNSSDVDVRAKFAPGHIYGFDFNVFQEERVDQMGRDVDLITSGTLAST